MFTKEEIYDQLVKMNAPKKSAVIIHSSLKSIGEVEGGGEGLLEVFIKYFTEEGGLLCIPTHTWNNVEDVMPIPNETPIIKPTLDMSVTKTCIGTLPDIAAAHKDAHRSMHPTHSMAVFGDHDKAEEFIKNEVNVSSSASPDGCYGNIYKQNGYMLLIGVGQTKNTCLHCAEEMLGVPNRLSKVKISVRIKDKKGNITERKIRHTYAENIGDVSKHYGKFEPAFRYFGGIRDANLGNAKVQICEANILKNALSVIYSRTNGKEILADDLPLDERLYK